MAVTTAINTANGEVLILDGLESSGGGGGGTSDYTELTNKPKINNVTLSGNKTGTQLGVADLSADNTFTGMNTFDDAILTDEVDDATGVNVISVADDGTRKVGSVLKGLKLASNADIEVRKGNEETIGTVIDSLNYSTQGIADKNLSNLSATGKSSASGFGMPSNTYTDLNLNTSYTAPANGWYVIILKFIQTGWVNMYLNSRQLFASTDNRVNGFVNCTVPVKKNDVVSLSYDANTLQKEAIRFIYAQGEV